MQNNGFIKLYRKILDNPVICKDSDYFTVWIYLLLNATHAEYDVVFKNERITLKPGQLITGRKIIADKFKIDENKVQRILKNLEKQHQLEQCTSSQNRLITIINWNEYQLQQQDEQQVNNEQTTSKQPMNTNKNIKNDNNIYITLFNKYKEQIEKENAGRKFLIISACKKDDDYSKLTLDEQNQLFMELMSIEKKIR